MKKILATTAILLFHTISFGQNSDIKFMVNSLHFMHADTLDCNAYLYWRIIAEGDKAIPFLIDRLTDTTQTNIKFHCKKTRLNVGEICHFALNEIGYFPIVLVTNMQFDLFHSDATGRACWSFYDWFFYNPNKALYQQKVRLWYDKNKLRYKSKKISEDKLTDCQKKFHIESYYQYIE